jgi:hypothetical protein
MNAHVLMDLMEILMSFVNYATVPSVNVSHHTLLLAKIASWLDAQINKNARKVPNASQLLAEFLIAHARKDLELKTTDRVSTSMNAERNNKLAALMLFVQTLSVDLLVHAPMATTEMLIMDCVHQRNEDVLPTKNVEQISNVFNQVNVFAHRRSLSMLEMCVEIPVKDSAVASMRNAHHLIVSVES